MPVFDGPLYTIRAGEHSFSFRAMAAIPRHRWKNLQAEFGAKWRVPPECVTVIEGEEKPEVRAWQRYVVRAKGHHLDSFTAPTPATTTDIQRLKHFYGEKHKVDPAYILIAETDL